MYALAIWTVGVACLGISLGIFLSDLSERANSKKNQDDDRADLTDEGKHRSFASTHGGK